MSDYEVIHEYTEIKHQVVVEAPSGVDPIDMDGGWQMQPERVSIRYEIRTQMAMVDGPDWVHYVEITGGWLPRPGRVRPGGAVLLPWHETHFPQWLLAMIEELRPAWRPELPPATGVKP